MGHPSIHARDKPEKPALIMAGSGNCLTYGELDRRSAAGANLMRSHGLVPGDHCALLVENCLGFFEAVYAAQRAGLIYTAIGTHLRAGEIAYILRNCDARLLVTSEALAPVAAEALAEASLDIPVYAIGGPTQFGDWDAALAAMPVDPQATECAGMHMLYSSGTTGRPKGIYPPWEPGRDLAFMLPGMAALRDYFAFGPNSVYLSPAPLYHAAPLIFNQIVLAQGGTSVIMEKFGAREALDLMERHRVTVAQFVPIMFVRMLKLRPEERAGFDLSSLTHVIHAAAPCPLETKREMIAWWGPILFEYYSSTENAGSTLLDSRQWQDHPGSVGRPLGCTVHIVGEDGEPLPVGETGEIFFENPHAGFEYYKEPEATAAARNARGWASVGDIGRLDAEGYLYLADRKDFMIISGGVNIYPQEVENALIGHPSVADVAVFGVPSEEFGEEVKAVVQPVLAGSGCPSLAAELMGWCRERISPVKTPRSIDFCDALPRLDNGKLYKKAIAARYSEAAG